ncbi:MAG: peptidylprolyl isomerase, partial [Bacteroidota bacterium]
MKRIGLLCVAILGTNLFLSGQVLDRIVAVVGDKIILGSDVEDTYNYYIINGQKDDGTLKCSVLENLILDKLMLNKAELDSIEVSESQVDAEVDRRVEYTLQSMDGSTEEFERIYEKPVLQFKEDIHDEVREQLLINRQKGVIFEEAKITPREVKQFFASIPKDSLGLLPAEVQLNHIVVNVPWSEDSKDKARKELVDLRKRIADGGEKFADLARRYSEDPGSRPRGGSLGSFG